MVQAEKLAMTEAYIRREHSTYREDEVGSEQRTRAELYPVRQGIISYRIKGIKDNQVLVFCSSL